MVTKRILILLTLNFLILGCKSLKTNHDIHAEQNDTIVEKSITKREPISCDNIKIDGFRILCLFELAFDGNSNAITDLIEEIKKDPDIIYVRRSKKRRMRGERLFKLVLELSNNFGCDHNLEIFGAEAVAKFHYVAINFKDMIYSIGEFKDVDKYIYEHSPKSELNFQNENCVMEKLYKSDWNAINTAWKDGKIKLKDFGQE